MTNPRFFYGLVSGLLLLGSLIVHSSPLPPEVNQNKYKTISALACDSLVKANAMNPDFVILDIRQRPVWLADHLSGSICRDYYSADFNSQINALPRNKIYLLHCQSGSRSAPTFNLMKNLNFAEVYEMGGGISAWKSNSLPTTSQIAPLLMLVSNGGAKKGTLKFGSLDTLIITVTNRGNDTLRFYSFMLPPGNEFSTDFIPSRKVEGAADFSFSVYYKPLQINHDSVYLNLASNGGNLKVGVFLKSGTVGIQEAVTLHELQVFPNPANNFISFQNSGSSVFQELTVQNLKGQTVIKMIDFPANGRLDVNDQPSGMYFIRIVSGGRISVGKLIIQHELK
jgi:rhodanese-related sulfurtransferase